MATTNMNFDAALQDIHQSIASLKQEILGISAVKEVPPAPAESFASPLPVQEDEAPLKETLEAAPPPQEETPPPQEVTPPLHLVSSVPRQDEEEAEPDEMLRETDRRQKTEQPRTTELHVSPVTEDSRDSEEQESCLTVYYNPVVQPMFNQTTAYEAAVSLIDKNLGQVSHEEFMPIAEKTEIVALLEQWVLEEVCAMLQKMTQKGAGIDYICVHVSARNVRMKNYIPNLLKLIDETGVSPGKLCLVISESAFNVNENVMIERMHELKKEGFKTALGDYGASYIPLSRLDSVPADAVMLDQHMTDRIFIDKKVEENAAAIIQRANKLGIEPIAKSVGDEIQKHKLMAFGCKKMQGILLGEPVKEEEVLNPIPYKKVMYSV